MFILWRQKAITSDRKVELFAPYFKCRLTDQEGASRRKHSNHDLAAWKFKQIYCEHRGPGRVALTPQLMHSERVNGRPQRKMLHCFATLRTCCRADPLMLAMWWHDVEETILWWQEWNSGPVGSQIARDKQAILDKLRQYAPRPSRKARQAFQEYRLEREAEAKRQREQEAAFRQEYARAAEEQRRQQEAAARAAQERRWQEQWRQAFEEIERLNRGANSAADPCWAALGLPPTANAEQLKARYRQLAFRHHPDRGGDGATFQKVQEAYYRAMQILGAS